MTVVPSSIFALRSKFWNNHFHLVTHCFPSLALLAEVGFPQFLVGVPSRDGANPFAANRQRQIQDTQIVGCTQNVPSVFAPFVAETYEDWIACHRILKL